MGKALNAVSATAATILFIGGTNRSGAADTQQDTNGGFNWPVPVVHTEPEWDVNNLGILGVRAVVSPEAQARILSQSYTAEEHRNVQSAINLFALQRSVAPPRSPNYKPTVGTGGFYDLHIAFINDFGLAKGSNDGYAVYSFPARAQTIDDIVAKGNTTVVSFRITGSVSGPMYGLKGIGQLIDIHEQLTYEWDKDGKLLDAVAVSEDGLPFYEQLGGKLEFRTGWTDPALALVAPPTVVGSSPPLASDAEFHEKVLAGGYSDQERRNIETLLAILAAPGGLERTDPRYLSANYRRPVTSPYFALDRVYGKGDGFNPRSLSKVHRQVTNFVAKGNELWVSYTTTADQSGLLFGVTSTGRQLTWNEFAFLGFDGQGKLQDSARHPGQGQLYLELGGVYSFPYGKYWRCEGCPSAPGIAHLDIPASSQ